MIPLLAAAAMPLIQELMGKGLTVLAGAVANKGKEFVEEKLGVKLEEQITPEKALQLKQLELDREDDLQKWALENRKLDIEEQKLAYADTNSARDLGKTLAQSTSWLNQNVVPLLAFGSIIGGILMILLSPQADVRMAGLSVVMLPLGYYFGTSQGSKQKQDTINRIAGDKP